MNEIYQKMIDMQRPVSVLHQPMSASVRAAQFASFAALVGFEDEICEEGRITSERVLPHEDAVALINQRLTEISENPNCEITVTHFVKDGKKQGGKYVKSFGRVSELSALDGALRLSDGSEIFFNDIKELEILYVPEK